MAAVVRTSCPLATTGWVAESECVTSVSDGAHELTCTVSHRLACAASPSLARSRAEGRSELEGMLKSMTIYEDGDEW